MSSIKEDIKKICKNIKWWNSSHYILFVLESILTSSIKHILFVLIYDGLITVIFKSWSSNTLATECEEPIHWKRSWYRERLRAEGEGDDSRWDGWMASPTQWTWVWVDSGSRWWTRGPGVLQFMGPQRVGHNWSDLAAAVSPKDPITVP